MAELVLLLTLGSPLVLVGRFNKKPQLGIVVWLLTFCSALVALVAIVTLLVRAVIESYENLNAAPLGSYGWSEAFVVSFLPWMLLALAGITLAQINQIVAPLLERARSTRALIELAGARKRTIAGMDIVELNVPAPFAAIARVRAVPTVVITKSAIDRLTSDELSAVIEHERAHLRLRHLEAKAVANAALALAPWLATSRLMRQEVERLCELAADDLTLTRLSPDSLAQARAKLTEAI